MSRHTDSNTIVIEGTLSPVGTPLLDPKPLMIGIMMTQLATVAFWETLGVNADANGANFEEGRTIVVTADAVKAFRASIETNHQLGALIMAYKTGLEGASKAQAAMEQSGDETVEWDGKSPIGGGRPN